MRVSEAQEEEGMSARSFLFLNTHFSMALVRVDACRHYTASVL